MVPTVHADSHSVAAHPLARAGRPLELLDARRCRDSLKALLAKEQSAMADFLVSLADFDARRGWEPLGHASLFAFLTRDLGLTPAPTFWRQEAARLLQRFPDLVGPLRHGKLCLTTMAELAKVLTEGNRGVLLPRFLGISTREAKEVVAELQPREAPATRAVATRPPGAALASCGDAFADSGPSLAVVPRTLPTESGHPLPALPPSTPTGVPPSQLWAPKVEFGGGERVAVDRDEIVPLTADLRRLHVTVSARVLKKLNAARDGLSHARPNATMEQVMEEALDLLLEKQARTRGQVKRPRALAPSASGTGDAGDSSGECLPVPGVDDARARPEGRAIRHRRFGPRSAIRAAVKRAVWARDGGRCSWPLDGGGTCGSTHRLELDHIIPWARGGDDSAANLRLTCARHNALAARAAFGARVTDRYVTPA